MKKSGVTMLSAVGLAALALLALGARTWPEQTLPESEIAILADGLSLPTLGSETARRTLSGARAALDEKAVAAAALTLDYPLPETVFPPDMVAPRLLWHDDSKADLWVVDLRSRSKKVRLTTLVRGLPPPQGEIDPACIGSTNEVYRPTNEQATARSWEPPDQVWKALVEQIAGESMELTVSGVTSAAPGRILSRGSVSLQVSKDRVGAPLFYRDVPLMPTRTEKNVIKPLSDQALPLIKWRLRDLGRRDSRVVLRDMPTCANCHSFSADGGVLGMDMDGPDGDKGAYAVAPVRPEMRITQDRVFSWNTFEARPKDHRTIGFLSQISPNGRYVITTLNEELYVANFTDYRFIQVFYPTRGILAYYDTKTEEMTALPGADDPAYVHCDPVWSPDGATLVFARARATASYAAGVPLATKPNDPNETQMRYDLYRMPFDGGRGGRPVPLVGASANGMSNSFPKVSPDGRFVVFVKAKNGQLLRPDGELWIVPLAGGEARRMRCNTPLMNSWHSFSPNGRWMVFSSKAHTPYTQLFLTHIDEQGESSPPILVPDSTAANRAANIPEFVNIPYDGLVTMVAPSVDVYRFMNRATELLAKNEAAEAVSLLETALTLDPRSVKAHLLLGTAFWRSGRISEALEHYESAVQLEPERAESSYSLSFALFLLERNAEAMAAFRRGFSIRPRWGRLPSEYDGGLGMRIPVSHREAAETCRRRLEQSRGDQSALPALLVLATLQASSEDGSLRSGEEAVKNARRVAALGRYQMPETLDILAGAYAEAGRFDEAVRMAEFVVWFADSAERPELARAAADRLALYRQGRPYRRAD